MYRDPGLVALSQNYLILGGDAAIGNQSSAALGAHYELENCMSLIPSRVARFAQTGALEKVIQFNTLQGQKVVNAIALINFHSREFLEVPGDVDREDLLKFRLSHGSLSGTAVWPVAGSSTTWATLTHAQITQWGSNIVGSFSNSPASSTWNIHIRKVDGQQLHDAEIGCVLLGRGHTFSSNPITDHSRREVASTTYSGRNLGQAFVREEAVRTLRVRTFHEDEDSRGELARLLAGRNRRSTASMLAIERLDLPTAIISPEMWDDTYPTFGGGIFGQFVGGIQSATGVNGVAISDVEFQEIPS
jgi:hypothetical protein